MRCPRCLVKVTDDEEPSDEAGFCAPCVEEREAPVPMLDVESVFAKGGPLATGNPRYEARPGQVRLARSVLNAIGGTADAGPHHLLAEGPCGVGKSKAYGVPAAHLAANGKRVLIVTASIALQEQLIQKDLPALRAELGWDFTFDLMKGRSNYLCREAMQTAGTAKELLADDARQFDEVLAWSKRTIRGDKSELLIKPSELVWGRFSTSSDACPGSKCPSRSTCFALAAKNQAAQAGVLVTNYHMFFLNMAYGGTLLPKSDVVILDEAHEAADIARELLGFRITEGTFFRYARDAEKRGKHLVAKDLRDAAKAFFAKLLRFADSGHYKSLLRWPAPFDAAEVVAAVDYYARECRGSHLVDHATSAGLRLQQGLRLEDANCVYSIDVRDGRRRTAALQARYIQPAPILSRDLWGNYDSVVAVSATITTDGRFDFARRELGAPVASRELVVETPFDFGSQALLVTPASDAPAPNEPAFAEYTAAKVIATIEASGGRTLALFTSYRALNAVHDRVLRHFAGRRGAPTILRQGDAPTSVLATQFKEDERSVLLGTSSFWTGVDVPGQALTSVVIDKLPFGQPDDPVTIRLGELDRSAFATYTVPKAILTLRQGVGRLIRSQRDIGAIVILDKRIVGSGYGKRFLESLPLMRRARSERDIEGFLRAHGIAA